MKNAALVEKVAPPVCGSVSIRVAHLWDDSYLQKLLHERLEHADAQSLYFLRRARVVEKYFRPEQFCVIGFGVKRNNATESRYYLQIPQDLLGEGSAERAQMRLWRFPEDPILTRLPQLFDRGRVAGLFSEDDAERHGVELGNVSLVPLKYRPLKRCAVLARPDSRHAPGAGAAIGKMDVESDVARVFEIMRELWLQSRRDGYAFAVAEPLTFDRAVGVLWQRRIPGETFLRFAGRAGLSVACRRVACALAGLHRVTLPPSRDLAEDELWRKFEVRVGLLAGAFPSIEHRLRELRRRCLASHDPQLPATQVSVHGDFNHGQILFRSGKPVILDLASMRYGDPGYDVAHFIAALHGEEVASRFPLSAITRAARDFYQTYGSVVPWRPSPVRLSRQIALLLLCRPAYSVLTRLRTNAAAQVSKYTDLANRYLAKEVLP